MRYVPEFIAERLVDEPVPTKVLELPYGGPLDKEGLGDPLMLATDVREI